MHLPEGMTQEEVLNIIDNIANGLAYKFRFGYYGLEDMKQEARLEALDALKKYDPKKGKLSTFLWAHVRNRLSNIKRNKFERYDKPCLNCPLKAYDPECIKSTSKCTEYEDKSDCKPYNSWFNRNLAKKNIVSPIGIQNVKDEHESNMREEKDITSTIYSNQIIDLLDQKIPVALRSHWVKLKNDIRLKKADKEKLLVSIREILKEANYGP